MTDADTDTERGAGTNADAAADDDRTRLATVDTVREERSWLFTIEDRYGSLDEVILVPCEDGVEPVGGDGDRPVQAWINRCTHEAQRLDRGFGAAIRNGEVICPKHGSSFETCSGECDNGEAAGTALVPVDVAVEDGAVYLVDDDATFRHEGGIDDGPGGDDDDDGGMPGSTSHIGF